jgi:hypothetical protein
MDFYSAGIIDEYVNTTTYAALTSKNLASYIEDVRTAILQMLHFIYFFNKYKYWVF